MAREVAGLPAGVAVGNRYGVAFHSNVLGRLGMGGIYHLARLTVLDRGEVDDARSGRRSRPATAPPRSPRSSPCTFSGLVGVMDNLAGHVEFDAFLAPRAWSGDEAPEEPVE
ncbi:MAG: hypothetical protein ACSLFR_17460 [Solirubrobacteraceae bacterium]